MRRRIMQDPYSAMALWSRRLALLALVFAGVGFFGARFGLDVQDFHIKGIDARMVLVVLSMAVVLACLALLASLAAMVIIWRTGRRGFGAMMAGFFLALALLAYPLYLANLAWHLPALTDISTDLDDPPRFSTGAKALAVRPGSRWVFLPVADRKLQKESYPDVEPMLLDSDAQASFRLVRQTVTDMGWHIVEAVPPFGKSPGHIDAIARGLAFGLPDDITIRIQSEGAETRIDMRSVSPYLPHDFGTNARRIIQFMAQLQGDEE